MESAPLIAVFVLVIAILVGRAITRERRTFARFRRMRSTAARQKVYRGWLVESVLIVGGLGAVVAFAAGAHLTAWLAAAQELEPVAVAREWVASGVGTLVALGVGALVLVGLVVPVLALRRTPIDEIPTIGNIGALLPRARGELPYGAGLALSAGVFEELLFRLALPALLYGITGSALVSIAVSIVLFGLLHLYQGPAGVIATTILGALLTALYLVTGTILAPIALHVLLDLRSLVLIPALLGTAWARPDAARVDRRARAVPPTPETESTTPEPETQPGPGPERSTR